MQFLKKINLKKYFVLSLISTGFCIALVWPNNDQILGICLFYVFTLINQGFLAAAVYDMFWAKKNNAKKLNALKVPALFVGKFVILILAVTLSVHFMDKNILIPLINYVIQIIILALSGINDAKT